MKGYSACGALWWRLSRPRDLQARHLAATSDAGVLWIGRDKVCDKVCDVTVTARTCDKTSRVTCDKLRVTLYILGSSQLLAVGVC